MKKVGKVKRCARYTGVMGDACEINYNVTDPNHSAWGTSSKNKIDTCYSRCPLTDRTTKDDLLCENNLGTAGILANDEINSRNGKTVTDPQGKTIGEYMYSVPAKNGINPDYYKLKRLGTGLGGSVRENADLLDNAKIVLSTLQGKNATRRDGKSLTLKSILEDYARINPKYATKIKPLIDSN